MADVIYGMDRGDQEHDIVIQATSPTKDIEVVIDQATLSEKSEILDLLDMIKNAILKDSTDDWS